MTEQEIPDIFTDGVGVTAGPYGVTVTLHLSTPESISVENDLGRVVARVRMNAELAEDVAGILKRVAQIHRKSQRDARRQKLTRIEGENEK